MQSFLVCTNVSQVPQKTCRAYWQAYQFVPQILWGLLTFFKDSHSGVENEDVIKAKNVLSEVKQTGR